MMDAHDRTRKSLLWNVCQTIAYIGAALLFDFKSYGVKNVPKRGGALLISNHQSYLDPVLLAVHLPRAMSYLAKSELFEKPAFRWLIVSLNAISLTQGKSDKRAIEETIRRLREGHLLNLFPEGSRTEDGEIAPIQRGAALVVRRAGVPIVPAVIEGSFRAWPRWRTVPQPYPVRVLYGKPLDVTGLKSEAVVALIDRTLHQMLEDLRAGNVRKYER